MIPGPLSATSMKASPAQLPTRTVVTVPVGVWERTLASMLSTTWRKALWSPVTSTGSSATKLINQSGPTARAVSTASAARPTKLDRFPYQGVVLVESGQYQEVLDQAPHPRRLAFDAVHHPAQVLLARGCPRLKSCA